MITETREIYKCEYCNKLYQIKRFAEQHEKQCTKNSDNFRICFGCHYLDKKSVDYTEDAYNGEHTYKIDILHCSKIDSYLYPPKVEIKGNSYLEESIEDGQTENKPMLTNCEHFKMKY